jgi:ribonuclease-3
MGLEKFVSVGKGMATAKAMKGSIAAGALESVIAAIYLDGGFEAARKFILSLFEQAIEEADASHHQNNFKSMLQQHAQQRLNTTPTYELLDEKGPDHNKCFECAVLVGTKRFKSAWGVTKKDAEQAAAYNALVKLKLLRPEKAKK